MSMENDTRLAMMALENNARRQPVPRRRRHARTMGHTAVSALAAFTLTLFTRSV